MITLYGFGQNLGLADPSPFVLKVHTFMRIAGIEYETVANMNNLQKAPKNKLPYIDDNGTIVADSTFIVKYLKEKYSPTMDEHVSQEQQAFAFLISKALEENLYWCLIYSRWLREDTWPTIKQAFFSKMPFPLKHIIPYVARKDLRAALHKQGIGRHSDEEILEITKETYKSMSVLLGDKTFFFGDKPCSFDATVFAFLASAIVVELDNPFTQVARSYPNLVNYCENIINQYY
ncbi:MAG: glutathione S-transferase family protein [Pseudomonadota bacterium]